MGFFGDGHLTQTGGTHAVADAVHVGYRKYSSGYNASQGVLSLEGGTFSADALYLGEAGSGELGMQPEVDASVESLLHFGVFSALSVTSGSVLRLGGADVQNMCTDAAALDDLANLELLCEGGSGDPTVYEAAGRDLGATLDGWNQNFALGTLTLGGADVGHLQLTDAFDNQPDWEGAEALYVTNLVLDPGAQVDLGGLSLYYLEGGNPEPLGAGDGLSLYYLNGGTPKQLFEGDADLSGGVDTADYFTLAANWFASGCGWAEGDFTGDGAVDTADYFALAENWYRGTGSAGLPLPEPAASCLVLAGVGAVLARGKRPLRPRQGG